MGSRLPPTINTYTSSLCLYSLLHSSFSVLPPPTSLPLPIVLTLPFLPSFPSPCFSPSFSLPHPTCPLPPPPHPLPLIHPSLSLPSPTTHPHPLLSPQGNKRAILSIWTEIEAAIVTQLKMHFLERYVHRNVHTTLSGFIVIFCGKYCTSCV